MGLRPLGLGDLVSHNSRLWCLLSGPFLLLFLGWPSSVQPKGGGDLGLTNLGVDNAPLLIVLRGANPAGEAFYFRRAKGDRTDKMRRKIKTKKEKVLNSAYLTRGSGPF
jgi:hypothetical protein